jgi:sulfur-oxidizing protein SoxX
MSPEAAMRTLVIGIVLAALAHLPAHAQQQPNVDPARADAAVKAAFPVLPPEWDARLLPDETMRQCSAHRNAPSKAVAEAIQQRERATIVYPSDLQAPSLPSPASGGGLGRGLIGDWKKGEAIAQSGYGQRFTDIPARRPNGGNCYACHQLTREEVSYGTLGPPLLNYGKLRNFTDADTKAAYDKIYNSHATFPCSNMPRFGSSKILTLDQIRDLVALLMSPDSPVNK